MMMVVAIELAKKFSVFRGLLQCLQEPTSRLNIVCTLNTPFFHILSQGGSHIFGKSRSHLRIVDPSSVTRSKSHIKDPQILGATVNMQS